ncbi:hypothetical protein BU24DRAFT_399961 [Aaosphaeria arxii CBS 175.79]|uniref:Uncharacterized protein n=1 Tax=Aaosphaeria arxii CBS 175.79 TaxID=1450172 RepID=A0A6A5XBT3_9PLEO|nr:uncharacterized protein BU24DRAFT_399961 [Aaosphaeria arxii CBS 175.79]KAF2010545.1 hypothetical protein BU24DRAFT_399961 [Aaosphaeria arxii CBS 175.79]
MVEPSPQTWTLRLKSYKTTVYLHVDPLSTFTSIKQALFDALAETSLVSTTGETITLPDSSSDIQLGKPVNTHDPRAGFLLGEWEYPDQDSDEEMDGNGKGKGKAKGRAKKTANGAENLSSSKHCPKGAGLRENAVLAFRWRGDGTGWEDEEDEASMWGVKIPSFEDGYGVENEGDVGGRPQFEG